MAHQFKVGDKARIVATALGEPSIRAYVGLEVVVQMLAPPAYDYRVLTLTGDSILVLSCELSPLLDPGCESFLQSMRDFAAKERPPMEILKQMFGEA